MKSLAPPQLPLWPFLLGDLALMLTAGAIYSGAERPFTTPIAASMVACVAIAAWAGVTPFLRRYRHDTNLFEAGALEESVQKIKQVGVAAAQVERATGYLQTMQDHSEKTAAVAAETAEKIVTEAKSFQEFMTRMNDGEKGALKLELEKAKRFEGDWLQTVTTILDHVHALHGAAEGSQQPEVAAQLRKFRDACVDASRRVGLTPFLANPGDVYDSEQHGLPKRGEQPPEGSVIQGVMACGYRYQGRIIRPVVVQVAAAGPVEETPADPSASEPADTDDSDDDLFETGTPS